MSPRRRPERKQFLTDLLSDALVGATYWSGIVRWGKDGVSAVIVDNEDDEAPQYQANVAAISRGISRAREVGLGSMTGEEYAQQFWLANRTNGEDGDYDADIADQLLQLGVLGEVRYG